MNVYLQGKKLNLSPKKAIGKGGEADIFALNSQEAIKVFKQPSHPDYQGMKLAQEAAKQRLAEHQQKLRQFPQHLPSHVIAPQKLITDKTGQTILGYTMAFLKDGIPLLKYSDRRFRRASGIDNKEIVNIFKQLYQLVSQLHQLKVIIGDFNDLNILLSNGQVYFIDADSYQFKTFSCRVFTPRFVDPLLCDKQGNQIMLKQAYNINSDWYALSVMLMQCLLFVEPFGGVYRPKNKQAQIPQSLRSLHRISIFNPEVKYPKPAIPYQVLSDDLLQYFYQCFEQDKRFAFPLTLLTDSPWYKCQSCGLESHHKTCPVCQKTVTIKPQKPSILSKNTLAVTDIFKTEGVILEVSLADDKLYWLYHEKQEFKRENNVTVLQGSLDSRLQFWLKNDLTLVGKQGQVIYLKSQEVIEQKAVDSYENKLMFRCNEIGSYWLYHGQLLKQGKLGQEYICDLLEGQTQFWIGLRFGFGLYRAGKINIAFVFNLNKSGINDSVKLPNLSGKLIDSHCTFSQDYCWFFVTLEIQGQLINKVYVIAQNGDIIAMTETPKTDNSWFSNLRGKFAFNNCLLAATDEGIIRLEIQNGDIMKTKDFPETEPWVNSSSYLFPSSQGIYVVNSKEIYLMSYQP
ncbi:MAG: hypothetical protein AB4080_25730 [Trichodesmium sp.]